VGRGSGLSFYSRGKKEGYPFAGAVHFPSQRKRGKNACLSTQKSTSLLLPRSSGVEAEEKGEHALCLADAARRWERLEEERTGSIVDRGELFAHSRQKRRKRGGEGVFETIAACEGKGPRSYILQEGRKEPRGGRRALPVYKGEGGSVRGAGRRAEEGKGPAISPAKRPSSFLLEERSLCSSEEEARSLSTPRNGRKKGSLLREGRGLYEIMRGRGDIFSISS